MIDLTSRQIQILRAVIEEYLETAEAVGSETIDRKYNLGVSPATIRNEMVYLSEQGYLKQLHTSAGRVPTPLALKLYVKELMNKKNLSVADEVSVKENIWENRDNLEHLLRHAAKELADRTKSIGIALTDDHQTYASGYAYLLNIPEFMNIDVTRTLFSLLEETQQLEHIFSKERSCEEIVHMIFGGDLGNQYLDPVSILFTNFTCANTRCSLGVIGSNSLDYSYIIPMLEHVHNMMATLVPGKK